MSSRDWGTQESFLIHSFAQSHSQHFTPTINTHLKQTRNMRAWGLFRGVSIGRGHQELCVKYIAPVDSKHLPLVFKLSCTLESPGVFLTPHYPAWPIKGESLGWDPGVDILVPTWQQPAVKFEKQGSRPVLFPLWYTYKWLAIWSSPVPTVVPEWKASAPPGDLLELQVWGPP